MTALEQAVAEHGPCVCECCQGLRACGVEPKAASGSVTCVSPLCLCRFNHKVRPGPKRTYCCTPCEFRWNNIKRIKTDPERHARETLAWSRTTQGKAQSLRSARRLYGTPVDRLDVSVRNARVRARQLAVPFDIAIKQWLAETQDLLHCASCGDDIDYEFGVGRHDQSPSLDRIVPENGYVPNGIRLTCWGCNNQRSDATIPELEVVRAYVARGGTPLMTPEWMPESNQLQRILNSVGVTRIADIKDAKLQSLAYRAGNNGLRWQRLKNLAEQRIRDVKARLLKYPEEPPVLFDPEMPTWIQESAPTATRCSCCGQVLSYEVGEGQRDDSPSIDRFVPALGYIRSNVRFVDWRCNNLKKDVTTVKRLDAVIAYMKRGCTPLRLTPS